MNPTDGMSSEEVDFWADLFYQAKMCGIDEITFSQFVSHPFAYLNPKPSRPITPSKNKAVHLTLVSSKAQDKAQGDSHEN